MKTVKNKQILVGADFAGYPLKEAVCEHLRKRNQSSAIFNNRLHIKSQQIVVVNNIQFIFIFFIKCQKTFA